jgi:hypothetical protein
MLTALLLSASLSAPLPKEPEPGPPMSVEQILAVLKDKGELTWSDGLHRLKVKKVDQLALIDFELQTFKDGKVVKTLKAKTGRIRLCEDPTLIRLFFDEGTLVKKGEEEAELFNQDFELPAPRTGKRP